MNSAAIEVPVTEPVVIRTRFSGMGLGLRTGGREQGDRLAGFGAAPSFPENSTSDDGYVGGLRVRDCPTPSPRPTHKPRAAATVHIAAAGQKGDMIPRTTDLM